MKLIIDIPEGIYEALKHKEFKAKLVADNLKNAVANGKPYEERLQGDLISRSALTEAEKIICKMYLEDLDKFHTCNEYKLLMSLIDNTSTVEERPKGEWIMIKNSDGNLKCYECSNCGKNQGYISNYCEDCGSDMSGGKE